MVITVTTFFRPDTDDDNEGDAVAISSVDTDIKSPTHNPGIISAQVGEGMKGLNGIRTMMMLAVAVEVPIMVLPMRFPLSKHCRCRCHRHRRRVYGVR